MAAICPPQHPISDDIDIVNDDGFGDEELDESSNFGVDRLMMFNGVEEPPFLKMGLKKTQPQFLVARYQGLSSFKLFDRTQDPLKVPLKVNTKTRQARIQRLSATSSTALGPEENEAGRIKATLTKGP